MARDKQAQSWSSVHGVKEYPDLVAQIFFPTDNAGLDGEDRAVLDSLVGHYKIALLGNHVSLKFVGRADHRGNPKYNEALGLRRAQAVQAYMELNLRTMTRFFSSSALSRGERGASKTDLEGDRRVDVHSTYVPKRPVIELPPISIVGQVPKRQVKRPVQFVDIERFRLLSDGPHEAAGSSWHEIVIETFQTFDEDRTVAYNPRQLAHAIHKSLPLVMVRRNRIDWRKSQTSDTAKSVLEVALKIISGTVDTAGDWDLGEGVPKLEPPNILYNSWAAYIARNGEDDIAKKYRGNF